MSERPSTKPRLFRISRSQDGGNCRIRLTFGHLTAAQARTIADAAFRFGNGIIDMTKLVNLHIRGVSPDKEAALVDTLLDAGLGPTRPEADDVRNVMVSPTAGLDVSQHMDILPIARDLLAHIETDETCWKLSAKFSFLVDGGEAVAAVDQPHDIWLSSMAGGTMIALGFAGHPPLQAEDDTPFVAIRTERAVAAIAAALSLFFEEARRHPRITRFNDLFTYVSRQEFFDRLSQVHDLDLRRGAEISRWRRQPAVSSGHVGIRDQREHGLAHVGAVPLVGRIAPETLTQLAIIAEENGDGSLRFTPWQSVIIPSVPREIAHRVMQSLAAIGLTCDPDDPAASMVACSGTPGCPLGTSDSKADARILAEILGSTGGASGVVHLSACDRLCAHPQLADTTLIATAPGVYDLFRRPAGESDQFGELIARDLSLEAAGLRIRETALSKPSHTIEPRG